MSMEKSLMNLINSSFSSGFVAGDTFARAIKQRKVKRPESDLSPVIFACPAPVSDRPGQVKKNGSSVRLSRVPKSPNKQEVSQAAVKDGTQRSRTSRSKRRKRRRRKSSNASRSRSVSSARKETEGQGDIHLKVNNGLIEFLEISMKHKRDRDAERKKREEEEKHVEYIDVSEVPYGSATGKRYWQEMGKKGEENERKMQELIELYGPDLAPEIAGIETTMQLNFERHCVKTKPALWPITPLNLSFSTGS